MNIMDEPRWVALKLIRALQHLESVNAEVAKTVKSDDCRVVADFKSEPGYLVVKATLLGTVSPLCSVYVGEALYQFRSALDNLICHLTERNGNVVNDKTEFPIFSDGTKFVDQNGNLTPGLVTRIGGLTAQQRAIVEAEQPFQRKYGIPSDDPLWALYELARFDRHKFLHLVGVVTLAGHEVFEPQWFADRYLTQITSSYGALEGETEIARFRISTTADDLSPPVAVEVKSTVTFGIAFDQKGPATGRPVVHTLKTIGQRVTDVVGMLIK